MTIGRQHDTTTSPLTPLRTSSPEPPRTPHLPSSPERRRRARPQPPPRCRRRREARGSPARRPRRSRRRRREAQTEGRRQSWAQHTTTAPPLPPQLPSPEPRSPIFPSTPERRPGARPRGRRRRRETHGPKHVAPNQRRSERGTVRPVLWEVDKKRRTTGPSSLCFSSGRHEASARSARKLAELVPEFG